ncbi:hypothetical protein [Xylophilus sp. GOD-11R]|uniref:hypothetical protein n=1 Tax=Xylophilus sp. GOD-11R TaxID=3089814 RepID=UPI00298CE962|nr:hypothetical protein [Xylophilus sp. GOD-11R]WPB58357.1 hypothetical protein R9X41_06855 [Xylophilus sp. GOD-11R]
MKIACLAWGSLLWKTAPLALATPWHDDGPPLPLDFCRVGDGGELATALHEGSPLQICWWALLQTGLLDEAREQLRQREQIDADRADGIGHLPADRAFPFDERIRAWMAGKPIDAVVWTALSPRFDGVEGRAPDAAGAARYLDSLANGKRDHAEQYIRRMPARFRTPTRSEIERRLGWTPLPEALAASGAPRAFAAP